MSTIRTHLTTAVRVFFAMCFRGATTGENVNRSVRCDTQSSYETHAQGLDVRTNPLPAKGKVFALDIPFCRTRPTDVVPLRPVMAHCGLTLPKRSSVLDTWLDWT
jgi:hypothetical protein